MINYINYNYINYYYYYYYYYTPERILLKDTLPCTTTHNHSQPGKSSFSAIKQKEQKEK